MYDTKCKNITNNTTHKRRQFCRDTLLMWVNHNLCLNATFSNKKYSVIFILAFGTQMFWIRKEKLHWFVIVSMARSFLLWDNNVYTILKNEVINMYGGILLLGFFSVNMYCPHIKSSHAFGTWVNIVTWQLPQRDQKSRSATQHSLWTQQGSSLGKCEF